MLTYLRKNVMFKIIYSIYLFKLVAQFDGVTVTSWHNDGVPVCTLCGQFHVLLGVFCSKTPSSTKSGLWNSVNGEMNVYVYFSHGNHHHSLRNRRSHRHSRRHIHHSPHIHHHSRLCGHYSRRSPREDKPNWQSHRPRLWPTISAAEMMINSTYLNNFPIPISISIPTPIPTTSAFAWRGCIDNSNISIVNNNLQKRGTTASCVQKVPDYMIFIVCVCVCVWGGGGGGGTFLDTLKWHLFGGHCSIFTNIISQGFFLINLGTLKTWILGADQSKSIFRIIYHWKIKLYFETKKKSLHR